MEITQHFYASRWERGIPILTMTTFLFVAGIITLSIE